MGGHFGQHDQKLHENYKINILGAKQCGKMGGQANLLGGEGSLRSLRLGETLGLVKINDLTN